MKTRNLELPDLTADLAAVVTPLSQDRRVATVRDELAALAARAPVLVAERQAAEKAVTTAEIGFGRALLARKEGKLADPAEKAREALARLDHEIAALERHALELDEEILAVTATVAEERALRTRKLVAEAKPLVEVAEKSVASARGALAALARLGASAPAMAGNATARIPIRRHLGKNADGEDVWGPASGCHPRAAADLVGQRLAVYQESWRQALADSSAGRPVAVPEPAAAAAEGGMS